MITQVSVEACSEEDSKVQQGTKHAPQQYYDDDDPDHNDHNDHHNDHLKGCARIRASGDIQTWAAAQRWRQGTRSVRAHRYVDKVPI